MDNLAAMQVFVKVVETGGLSAAARALGIAPSSVTRRVNELEDMLGVQLLRRTTRKLSLTEAGEVYFERTREIVQAVAEAHLAVTEKRTGPSGTLTITVPASVARLHLAPAVAAFQMQYPEVRVVMRVTDRILDVIEESVDVAVRVGRLKDSSMIAKKVGEVRRLVCASPAYLKRCGKPEHPEDLRDNACLSFRTHAGDSLWRFKNGEDQFEIQVTGPFFADNGETLVAGACAGLGLILVPEWLVGVDIHEGRLVEVLSEYPADPAETPLYAVYAPGAYTPPKVRTFVDFLTERFLRNYNWRKRH